MFCAVFIGCTSAILSVTHCYLLPLVVARCITRCHPFSLVASLFVTRCNSLSLVVIRCHLLNQSLSLVVSLVVTRCATRCHSLSFVVTRCTTHCHSLSLVVPLAVTRCTTSLFFYKRSDHMLHYEQVFDNDFERRESKCCGVLIKHCRKVKGELLITLQMAWQLKTKNINVVSG